MLTVLYTTLGFLLGLTFLCGENIQRRLNWFDLVVLLTWIVLWPFVMVAEIGNAMSNILEKYEE